jgi:hypothetical protein
VTYSLDEMTGIQALERVMPEIDMKPGRCVRVEFEYQRHGTQSLIATFNVATGGIDHASVEDTRTEQDLDAHLKALLAQVANVPKIHLVMDCLNTHQSEALAGLIHVDGRKSILEKQSTRLRRCHRCSRPYKAFQTTAVLEANAIHSGSCWCLS